MNAYKFIQFCSNFFLDNINEWKKIRNKIFWQLFIKEYNFYFYFILFLIKKCLFITQTHIYEWAGKIAHIWKMK